MKRFSGWRKDGYLAHGFDVPQSAASWTLAFVDVLVVASVSGLAFSPV